jgi:eukaryotic-like serine/threonine-protein kinase
MIGSRESWPVIERVFHQALPLPAGARAALLASVDPAVRASVERLLRASDEPADFLEQLDPLRAAELLEIGADPHPPATIDRYRVIRQLGRGGMGVVYLAEDPRLERHVALKLLPVHLHADPRAERLLLDEARAACALDHPHIATIYEVGQAQDGRPFIAMAYYDGETLRARLAPAPLTEEDALRIAVQITDGLAAAHANGIVHRDIKPENILITRDGRVKILDFGLARMEADAAPGAVRGTAAYMSPEQVRGETVDARSDVWSLGVVLYELLAGVRPFTGDERAVLRAISEDRPAPMPASLTPALARIVERCLRPQPEERYPNAGMLLEELGGVSRSPGPGSERDATGDGGAGAGGAVVVMRRPRMRILFSTALVAGAGTLAFLGWTALSASHSGPTVSNVRQITRAPEPEVDPVLSPDGRFLAYAFGWDGYGDLFVRDLRRGQTVPLTYDVPGSHYGPRWTPGGDSIVFHTAGSGSGTGWPGWSGYQGRSSVMPRLGGPASPFAQGRVWDFFDHAMLYTVPGGLLVRDDPGMAPRQLAGGGLVLHSARFSPDGEKVVFVEGGADVAADGWSIGNVDASGIRIVPTAGGDVVRVTDDFHQNVSPVWLPDGRRILFLSNRDGPSDIYLLRLGADGRPLSAPVRVTTGLDAHTISISADGRAVAFARILVRRNVRAVDIPEEGSVSISAARPVTTGNQRAENHGVSKDGSVLLFDSNLDGNQDIYALRLGEDEPRRLTRHPADDFHPDLSPDGRTVAFYSTRFGTRDLFLMNVDGSAVTRLTSAATEEAHPTFSPDGNSLCFEVRGGTDQPHPMIAVMTRADSGAPWGPARRIAAGWTPHWSPEGDRLVLEADSGIVTTTLAGDERVIVRRTWQGFAWPHWAPDGTIYFRGTDDGGQAGIFAIASDGGSPRMIVRLDDPRFKVQYGLSVAGNTLFMSVTEYESDIWMLNLDVD